MSSDADEDALRWAGDDERGRDSTSTPPAKSERESERKTEAKPDSKPEKAEKPEATEQPPTPALLLVSYGILGGAYLVYTVGWVISIQRSTTVLPTLFGDLMFRLGEGLAIGSPAMWLLSVFLLTRGRPATARLLWLLLGLIVVIPWPFVLGV